VGETQGHGTVVAPADRDQPSHRYQQERGSDSRLVPVERGAARRSRCQHGRRVNALLLATEHLPARGPVRVSRHLPRTAGCNHPSLRYGWHRESRHRARDGQSCEKSAERVSLLPLEPSAYETSTGDNKEAVRRQPLEEAEEAAGCGLFAPRVGCLSAGSACAAAVRSAGCPRREPRSRRPAQPRWRRRSS
jgi:hypothetical protein